MGFWSLFIVASSSSLQVLLIGLLGAYLATGYSNVLAASARRDMNRIVFTVFTPSLMFANLAKSVTFQDIISWWFMPANIGIAFLAGGILGWIVVKILKPEKHLEGIIIATSSAGNLGNLLLVIVPAVCKEPGSPFGDSGICNINRFSYVSFSMALGGFFIWTHSFGLIKKSSKIYHTQIGTSNGVADYKQALVPSLSEGDERKSKLNCFSKLYGMIHQIGEELLAPPNLGAASCLKLFLNSGDELSYPLAKDAKRYYLEHEGVLTDWLVEVEEQ